MAGQFFERFDKWRTVHDSIEALAQLDSKRRASAITTGVNKKAMDALKAQFAALNGAVAREMAAHATASEEVYAGARQTLIGMVAAALLVAAGTGLWMALSISRGLGLAVGLADGVAMGDLDRRISVHSNDEIKDLVDALNRMTANLRATATVADSIAQGDLSMEAKPLSDKDTLGLAMQRMTANLRGTAKIADTIAQGDLSVEAKPLSDKDTLGLAMQRMTANLRATAKVAGRHRPGRSDRRSQAALGQGYAGPGAEGHGGEAARRGERCACRLRQRLLGQPGNVGQRRAIVVGRHGAGGGGRGGFRLHGADGRQHQAERRQCQPDREDRAPVGGRRRERAARP